MTVKYHGSAYDRDGWKIVVDAPLICDNLNDGEEEVLKIISDLALPIKAAVIVVEEV